MFNELLKSTITLFIIMDGIGILPIFLSFFKGSSEREVASAANKAFAFSTIILLPFLFLGPYILRYFSVTINDFKIAGGIILFIIGIKFVLGIKMIEFKNKKYGFASVPIATPLIIGPGIMTTALILVQDYGFIIPLIASIINLIIVWILLRNSKIIFRMIGHQGSDVISRIMGLIIAAIAVSFIRSGLV